ncbi:hypothetical protein RISK_001867 [Rhodopirellula islandica]|uniref:Uncharacterized protein n=1 Tax=Rhodopirellula islandica TaxID=595434 RepID=A0A0J1BHK7_RHOIS|nr:hypothetical protein RISK_001867 [Rhodopirellula islandica]
MSQRCGKRSVLNLTTNAIAIPPGFDRLTYFLTETLTPQLVGKSEGLPRCTGRQPTKVLGEAPATPRHPTRMCALVEIKS